MVQTRSSSQRETPHVKKDVSRAPGKPGLSLTSLSASEVDVEDDDQPAKKRLKKNKDQGQSSKRSRRRGRLEMMPQMNLDVLFHIFSFMHPMDLLNLARTTKAFRQLLMQKSSAFIWKASRLQLEGFPDCPDDLSEPQYINLAFYPHCHNCGKIAQTVYWRIRRRYCRSCRQICLTRSLYVRSWDVVPSDYILLGKHQQFMVVADELNAFLGEYESLPEDKRDGFVQARSLQTGIISAHARECEDWFHKVAVARKLERSDTRKARKDDIFNRLINLGYESEIDCFGKGNIEQSERAIFHNPKALTDREWNRARPALVKKMEDYRVRLREKLVYSPRRLALVRQYGRYVRNPAPPGAEVDILPHVADVATFEPFAAIINSSPEVKVDDKSFEPAFEQLPALVQEWRETIEARFASLVVFPSDSKKPEAGQSLCKQETVKPIDRLKLASAVFTTPYGDTIFTYPGVLYYPRCNPSYSPSNEEELCDFGTHTWSGLGIIRYFSAAADIVHVCGLDPESASVGDMEQRDARLICGTCRDSCVRTWKNAILHSRGHYGSKVDWTLVDDCYLEDIKAIEDPPFDVQPIRNMLCLSCQRRVGDNWIDHWGLGLHMRTAHGIKNKPEEGVHYYVCVDFPWLQVREVRMIKEEDSVTFRPITV